MYFHGEIYPLKLEMVKNLTVVLQVGGSDGWSENLCMSGGVYKDA
jgi:hypothetical protein